MRAIQGMVAAALMAFSALASAATSVNVNTADAKTLDKELAGVGKVTATRIVEERKNGEFRDVADLSKRVNGFGAKTAAKNKEKIRFKD